MEDGAGVTAVSITENNTNKRPLTPKSMPGNFVCINLFYLFNHPAVRCDTRNGREARAAAVCLPFRLLLSARHGAFLLDWVN